MSEEPTFDLGHLIASHLREFLPASALDRIAGRDEREVWRQTYWSDPVAWARDHIRWRGEKWLAPYQQDTLNKLVEHKRVAAYGCRGFGKTMTVSMAVLWMWSTRDGFVDWMIPTTAGGYRQLEKYLWPEIRKWAGLLRWDKLGRRPLSRRDELMTLSLRGETGEAFAAASTDPNLIEGAHASQMLFVLDESKSIPDGVFDSIEGMLTQAGVDGNEAYLLATSTPGPPRGRFWQICVKREGFEDWYPRPVTIQEAIAAGRVSEEWAKNRARQWGTASVLFQTHVLGRFSETAEDGVIPAFWVEDAQARAIPRTPQEISASGPEDGAKIGVIAVDVARGGCNESVIAIRRGWAVLDLIAWQGNDTMEVVQKVVAQAKLHHPHSIIIDVVGVGAGVYDRLRQLEQEGKLTSGAQPSVVAFHGGETAPDKDSTGEIEFADRRSWAWWHLRELLHPYGPAKLVLPEDQKLLTDLTVVTYAKVGDRLKVAKKEDIERRLRQLNPSTTDSLSPDRGDAVVMAFSDACSSHYEEAYAMHTGASLGRDAQAMEVDEREEERRERERNARAEAQQVDWLLWRNPRNNTESWWRD